MTRCRPPALWTAGPRWLLFALAANLNGCEVSDDVIATRSSRIADGGSPSVAGAGGSSAEVCPGFVPSIPALPTEGTRQEQCAGWLGRRAFSQAVCSCGDLSALAVLVSDARDSGAEDTSPDRTGAAIGIDGNYAGGEYVRIGGSFTVRGEAPTASRGGIDVAGDLRLAAPTSAAGPIFVGRDAWLLRTASSQSLATVGRDLRLGPSGALDAPGLVLVGGATLHEPFTIAAPCACAAEELVDIAAIVGDGLARPDNGRIGLGLDSLRDVQSPTQLALECGRYALRQISGDATIALRIAGRVLLFVDGDVDAGKNFSLELERGAELDWFIRGNLSVSSEARLGDNDHPGATRVYVLGSGDIALPGTARFSANLYAPHAHVTVGALGDIYGSVFAAAVTAPGPLLAHYDRAVLRADSQCAVPPPARCASCEQCGGESACVAGTCAACSADSDCCFPLVCDGGKCQALNSN